MEIQDENKNLKEEISNLKEQLNKINSFMNQLVEKDPEVMDIIAKKASNMKHKII